MSLRLLSESTRASISSVVLVAVGCALTFWDRPLALVGSPYIILAAYAVFAWLWLERRSWRAFVLLMPVVNPWGYEKVESPFNSQGGGFQKTTSGRVQTPTLAILAEREERIRIVAERLGISQQRLIERYPALVAEQRKVLGAASGSDATDRALVGDGGEVWAA